MALKTLTSKTAKPSLLLFILKMKKNNSYKFSSVLIKLVMIFFSLHLSNNAASQTCLPSFQYIIGSNGNVTFYSTSGGILPSTNYSWGFGSQNIPAFSGAGNSFTATTVTYSIPGIYTVSLTITNTTPACSQTYSAIVNVPNCAINFSTTPANGSQCTGAATVNAPGYCGTPTYTWSNAGFGSNQFSLCAGVYSVVVSGSTPSCCPTNSTTINIFSINLCPLVANFQYSIATNGVVIFTSTSTGTIVNTNYLWNFGDSNVNFAGAVTSHTYASPGFYSAQLIAINNSVTCLDSSQIQIIVPNFCGLTSSIVAQYGQAGAIDFTCIANGTNSTSTYSWEFGDGAVGSGSQSSHSYSLSQLYTVKARVSNNTIPLCNDSSYLVVNGICAVSSAMTHTVGGNGLVTFNSQALGTNSATTYLWDFGDGYGDIAPNPIHQYSNAGTHYVKLKVNNNFTPICQDSLIQAINITGINCAADANFSLVPSSTPQYWYAIPNYPYNVSAARWSWGDGSTSNTMYASHTYSNSGFYSVCLSVTVSCNDTISYCSSQYLSKPAGAGMVYVNVQEPSLKLGLTTIIEESAKCAVYPNPSDGNINLVIPSSWSNVKISITDLSGRVYLNSIIFTQNPLQLSSLLSEGLYLLHVSANSGTQTIKLIIKN